MPTCTYLLLSDHYNHSHMAICYI